MEARAFYGSTGTFSRHKRQGLALGENMLAGKAVRREMGKRKHLEAGTRRARGQSMAERKETRRRHESSELVRIQSFPIISLTLAADRPRSSAIAREWEVVRAKDQKTDVRSRLEIGPQTSGTDYGMALGTSDSGQRRERGKEKLGRLPGRDWRTREPDFGEGKECQGRAKRRTQLAEKGQPTAIMTAECTCKTM